MLTPERFNEVLLDYLYDLLDANEARAVLEYVEAHPEAKGQLDRTRTLLAGAARCEFPDVRFTAPTIEAMTAPAPRSPVASPSPAPAASGRMLRWLVAAAAVIAVAVIGYPVAKHVSSFRDAQASFNVAQGELENARNERDELVAKRRKTIDGASKQVVETTNSIQQLREKQVEELTKAQNEAAKKEMMLQVTGPPAIQPGAPNAFVIETRNKTGDTMVSAKLGIQVKDQNEAVLYEEKDVHSQGMYTLHLPPDLPFKPDTQLKLDVTAAGEGPARGTLSEQLPWAPPRYVTHLATDKPMYKPGQTIYFRSLTLNRANLRPPEENFDIVFTITSPMGAEVYSNRGETRLLRLKDDRNPQAILGPDQKPVRGIGAGEFAVSENAEGGEYTLSVREASNRFPEEKRKFIVNKYTPERLNKDLDFHRKSYGAGAEVIANCKVTPAGDKSQVRNIRYLGAVMVLDDSVIGGMPIAPMDALGRISVKFQLPKQIDKGKASVSIKFSDGAATETLQKPVPIIVKRMFVDFFPEGGDLIAGVPNRVYFQAKNNLDKPADLKGRLLDSHGNEVARAATVNDDREAGANQGLGAFTFTPQKDEKYELKIDEPAGIEKSVPLVANLKTSGIALSVPTGVTDEGQPIRVELRGTEKAREILVGAYCRGRLLDQQSVRVEPGQVASVELKPAESIGGVVRITAFEKRENNGGRPTFEPRAERLVYRKSPRAVRYRVEPNKPVYAPGDSVTLKLSATDEKGNPARAVALVSVVDKSVVTMADEKTARGMKTHFGLAGEIKKAEDLEHADFLLADHEKAPVVLDLLLGVQGWRRFAEQSPDQFRQQGVDAERLVILEGASGPRGVNSFWFRQEELNRDYEAKLKDLSDQLVIAYDDKGVVAKQQDDFTKSFERENAAVAEKKTAADAALAALKPYDDLHQQFRRSAFPALAGVTAVLALVLVVVGVMRGAKRGVPCYIAASACIAVAALLVVSTSSMSETAQRGGIEVVQVEPPAFAPVTDPAEPMNAIPEAMEGAKLADPAQRDLKEVEKFHRDDAGMPPPGPLALGAGAGGGPPRGGARPFPAPATKPAPMMPRDMPPDAFDKKKGEDKAKKDENGIAFNKKMPEDLRLQFEQKREAGKGMARFKDDAKPAAPAKDVERLEEKGDHLKRFDRGRGEAQDRARQVLRDLDQNLARRGEHAGGAKAADEPMAGMGGVRGRVAAGGFGGGGGGFGRPGAGGRGFPLGAGGAMPAPGMPGGGPGGPGFPGGLAAAPAPMQPPLEPFFVREYAHLSKTVDGEVRNDFAETVFWNPVVVSDETGNATVSFQLGDSVTSYRVLVAGHTLDGRIGDATEIFDSRKPFNLESRLPAEMTASDKLDLPLQIINNTGEQRKAKIDIAATNLKIDAATPEPLTLEPNQRSRRIVRIQPSVIEGEALLTVTGTSEPRASDGFERSIRIVPDGFPAVESRSDLLEKVARQEIVLPKDYVKGSLKVRAQIYPSTLADLQQGLAALLREPGGCFEQTSSSNYPNTLILNYIKTSGEKAPDAVKNAEGMLDRGYQKLVSFECMKNGGQSREGYEWFGGMAPPHEALTAYGLLEFHDMAKVHAVDPEMVARTRQYLLSRRLPDGGFMRNAAAIDTFGRAPQHITDAYIIWALTETGKDDVTKDIEKLLKNNADSTDPYFLSLMANSLVNIGDGGRAAELLKKVRGKQAADGGLDGATTSITCSGGRELRIETTALAVLGWLKVNRPADFTEPLGKAIRWIGTQRGGYGGFGSTQSTILALKALIAYTKDNQKTAEAGDLTLYVGDQVIGRKHFEKGAKDTVTVEVAEPEKFLKPGKNDVRLEVTSGSFPYTITWEYASLTPLSSDKCSVRLSAKLDKDQVSEGDGVRLTATLENVAGKGLPMTVAIIGLPAGLKVPEDMKQLKEMAQLRKTGPNGELEAGEISYFEIRGRELVLYWRDVKPDAKVNLTIDLIAEIPGQFRGPASRAYLYYNADPKHWIEPLAITISAAK